MNRPTSPDGPEPPVAEAPRPVAPDSDWLRQVLGQYPTGVSVVTGIAPDGDPVGLVVGTFTSVSLEPPLVAFMPDKASTSWPRMAPARAFCINVLSEDQEDVCRTFATTSNDKFSWVGWRSASSGAPIIEGALAWIDCDLEAVHEAGDHFIVLGRVRELDVQTPSLPLLFFQGGYGRFTPKAMATIDGSLGEQLRVVDVARPEMDRVVAELSGRCNASALIGEELVLMAGAGEITSRTPQLIGARLPAVPGMGMLYMAYASETRLARYLGHLASDEERDDYRERLRVLRGRGYSVGVRSPLHAEFEQRSRSGELARGAERLPPETSAFLRSIPYDPPGFTLDQASDVRSLHAPVFGPHGDVTLALNFFFRSGRRRDRPEIEHCLGVLLDAARRVTIASGGRPGARAVSPGDRG
ncbi:MAG: flavin reductase domain protein FMN-binding protein [Solirubrobacterales bacterium]|nr:flavin reductase domain protein FMN-binding protein [Solirubrobacterales bacterium]